MPPSLHRGSSPPPRTPRRALAPHTSARLHLPAAPALASPPQVSGDPKGFDLTGDGERWEAAGGDEISEAAEFPTVRRRAAPALLPAEQSAGGSSRHDAAASALCLCRVGIDSPPARSLGLGPWAACPRRSPARSRRLGPAAASCPAPAGSVREVGGGAGPGGRKPGVGARAGGALAQLLLRAANPLLRLAASPASSLGPGPSRLTCFAQPPRAAHPPLPAHLPSLASWRPCMLQWEALWKNLQKWGRALTRAGLDFGSDTGMAELQDISE